MIIWHVGYLSDELESRSEYFRKADFKLVEKRIINTNIRIKFRVKK